MAKVKTTKCIVTNLDGTVHEYWPGKQRFKMPGVEIEYSDVKSIRIEVEHEPEETEMQKLVRQAIECVPGLLRSQITVLDHVPDYIREARARLYRPTPRDEVIVAVSQVSRYAGTTHFVVRPNLMHSELTVLEAINAKGEPRGDTYDVKNYGSLGLLLEDMARYRRGDRI